MLVFVKKVGVNVARYARAFLFTCLNLEVFFNGGLALLSTYLTNKNQWDVRYRLDNVFLTMAVISPLTAIISLAFARREAAAEQLSQLSANCINLYMLHRDWHRPEPGDLSTVGDNNTEHVRQLAGLIEDFYAAVKKFLLRSDDAFESRAEMMLDHLGAKERVVSLLRNKVDFKKVLWQESDVEEYKPMYQEVWQDMRQDLDQCYQKICQLFMWNEMRVVAWGTKKPGDGGIPARTNGILGNIVNNFEQIRLIHDYRTPVMLRYGTRILIYVYAVFLGPSLNNICDAYEEYRKAVRMARRPGMPVVEVWEIPCIINYVVAVLLLVSITVFVRIGNDLEYPFDLKGLDDILLDPEDEFKEFVKAVPDTQRRHLFHQLVQQDKQHKE